MRRFTTAALATFGFFAATGPARAFYWFDWPGSGVTRVPTLVEEPNPANPPPPPGGSVEPTPAGPEVPIDQPGGPNHVPEPATALLALAGLGALAARKWRKN